MTQELIKKVTAFRTAVSVVKEMLNNGIITDVDYAEITTELAGYYGLSLSTIFQ